MDQKFEEGQQQLDQLLEEDKDYTEIQFEYSKYFAVKRKQKLQRIKREQENIQAAKEEIQKEEETKENVHFDQTRKEESIKKSEEKIEDHRQFISQFEKESLKYIDKAIQLNPKYKEAHQFKADLLCQFAGLTVDLAMQIRDMELQEVQQDEQSTVQIDERNALNQQIGKLIQIADVQMALKTFDQATNIDGKYFHAYFDKGIILHRLKRYEEAVACFDSCLEILPQHQYAHQEKGLSLYELGDYDAAIEQFNQAIVDDKQYRDGQFYLALAYYQLQLYDRARVLVLRAIAIDKNFQDATDFKEVLEQQMSIQRKQQDDQYLADLEKQKLEEEKQGNTQDSQQMPGPMKVIGEEQHLEIEYKKAQ